MIFNPDNPPASVCLLRLSALGDITHTLPLLRTLQTHWPATKITWIIGKNEYRLVKDIPGVHFVLFDKTGGFTAYKDVANQLRSENFDILFQIQVSLRASMLSRFINARIKLGFERERAKDFQWLFSNERISPASTRQHVVDSFLEFAKHFGLEPVYRWDLPVSTEASKTMNERLGDTSRLLVINPCAVAKSKNWRNWTVNGYATVADFAHEKLGMPVVLTGGPSESEKNIARKITDLCKSEPINLVGQTSIEELVATLSLASVLIAPDTGPAHIGSALGIPVIGLYAATNPDRAAPYNSRELTVNRYPQAIEKYFAKKVEELEWGKRVRNDECMQLITVGDVTERLTNVVANLNTD